MSWQPTLRARPGLPESVIYRCNGTGDFATSEGLDTPGFIEVIAKNADRLAIKSPLPGSNSRQIDGNDLGEKSELHRG